MNPADTPLLLIAWRRPHTLRQVINAIRPVAPSRVFVACDGPNSDRPGEAEKVAATHIVIETEIDWPCQIERLYSDLNQGCRLGVSRAITWFFEHVDEGIILEDDCVPHPDFFFYCAQALATYKDSGDVFAINGNNFQASSRMFRGKAFDFVSLSQAWGWATWSDRWFPADPYMQGSRDLEDLLSGDHNWKLSRPAVAKKKEHLRQVMNGLDTWDYIWQAFVLDRNGLVVSPCSNLISNIGNGRDATHTQGDSRTFAFVSDYIKTKIIPSRIKLNVQLTRHYEVNMGLSYGDWRTLLKRRLYSSYRFLLFVLRSSVR